MGLHQDIPWQLLQQLQYMHIALVPQAGSDSEGDEAQDQAADQQQTLPPSLP